MTEELTTEATPLTATPAAAPAPTPSPSPNPDIIDPETGRAWKIRFHGAHGARLQAERELAEVTGKFEQAIKTLQETLNARDAELAAANSRLAALEEQTGAIPALQEQNKELAQMAMMADKYKLLMRYPNLLSINVEEQADEGTGRVNPVLSLIESTTMPLGDLERTLQQMTQAIPVDRAPVRPAASAPAIPQAPPQQNEGEDISAAWARIQEVKLRLNESPNDLQLQQEFREAWQRYYAAQVPE